MDVLETMDRKNLERAARRHLQLDPDTLKEYDPPALRLELRRICNERGIDVNTLANRPASAQWAIQLPTEPGHAMGLDYYQGNMRYSELYRMIPASGSQRKITKSRLPKIADYVNSRDGSVDHKGHRRIGAFPSVICSIRGPEGSVVVIDKNLFLTADAVMRVPEGQHRLEGTKLALPGLDPSRLQDTLPVTYYVGLTDEEERQLFSDINSTIVKVTKSQTYTYDSLGLLALLAKEVAAESRAFAGKTAFGQDRVGDHGLLFSISNIAAAVEEMTKEDGITDDNFERILDETAAFWDRINTGMVSVWKDKDSIATNRASLVALARLKGFSFDPDLLESVDWSKSGPLAKVGGGSNAAVAAIFAELTRKVVVDKNPE